LIENEIIIIVTKRGKSKRLKTNSDKNGYIIENVHLIKQKKV